MNNKKDIEKGILIAKDLIMYFKQTDNEKEYEIVEAIENILVDREKYKQLYERALSDLVSAEKENERLKTKYEANNSKTLLTAENLKELEEHCKRQVQRYETNKKMKEEHLLILELLYSYNQNEAKANKYDSLIKEIEDKIEDLDKIAKKKDVIPETVKEEKLDGSYVYSQRFTADGYIAEAIINILQELLDTEKEKI